jgi:multiple sugar transport system permease protein
MAISVPIKRPGRVRRVARDARKEWSAYAFLSPGLLLFIVFTIFALGFSFYLSFHEWSLINDEKPYVGLENYSDILDDERFHRAVANTFYFTGGSVPVTMFIGLLVALLLNEPLRGRAFFRAAFFLPVVTPFVVVAILWKWLYNGDFGLFNYYLGKIGLINEPLRWLADPDLAMPSVIIMSIWSGIGFSMVIYLAGLQSIPEELYEAAKVDGAGPVRRFWHITVPMLTPTSLFLLVIGIIGSLQVFTQIFVMTQGGPVERTTTMVYFIYLSAFKFFEFGYASALAYFLFALVFLLTLFQLRLYRRYAPAEGTWR